MNISYIFRMQLKLSFWIWKNWVTSPSFSNLAQQWWCTEGRESLWALWLLSHIMDKKAFLPSLVWGGKFQLMPKRYPALGSDEENQLVLPTEKAMKYSLFLKLPLSSRKWPGSNTSGLRNSLWACSTEVSNVNTSVPWKEQMKINWTTQKSWSWTTVANHLVQFYDL